MTDAGTYVFALVVLLGVLIFVHELGHFLVAKWCGVRVLKFSLGFGPPVGIGRFQLRWERGGTEYVVAWFPLGGFVKMLGENMTGLEGEAPVPDARPDEYLSAKPTWQKLAIYLAGPVMNLLLPVLAFWVMLGVGLPRPAAVVGTVEADSPAAKAGLEPGDRIEAVDGNPVRWWDDVEQAVRDTLSGPLTLRVDHDGVERKVTVDVEPQRGLDEFGDVKEMGWAGLGHRRLPAVLGVTKLDVPAARAGLRPGDVVRSVNGTAVEDWEGFRHAYAAAGRGPVRLEVARGAGTEPDAHTLEVEVPALGSVAKLGVVPATVFVAQVTPDSPAERAGLRAGDLILSVDGEPVGSFLFLLERVRSSEGRPLHFAYARNGETHQVVIKPELKKIDTGLGIDEDRYLIGIQQGAASLPGALGVDRERNPFVAVPRAVSMTVEYTANFLQGLGKLATGEIGRDKLAGPIGIAEIAGKSLQRGWEAYLFTVILISINLGILNLLPIPILDGGQILIVAVEGIQRAPISLRTREIVQQVGLTMLVLLMGLAFWNDLSRNWSKLVEWLSHAS